MYHHRMTVNTNLRNYSIYKTKARKRLCLFTLSFSDFLYKQHLPVSRIHKLKLIHKILQNISGIHNDIIFPPTPQASSE